MFFRLSFISNINLHNWNNRGEKHDAQNSLRLLNWSCRRETELNVRAWKQRLKQRMSDIGGCKWLHMRGWASPSSWQQRVRAAVGTPPTGGLKRSVWLMFETVEIIRSGNVKQHYKMCSEQTTVRSPTFYQCYLCFLRITGVWLTTEQQSVTLATETILRTCWVRRWLELILMLIRDCRTSQTEQKQVLCWKTYFSTDRFSFKLHTRFLIVPQDEWSCPVSQPEPVFPPVAWC